MSVRLWHSILYDYSVELVPMIGTKIDSGSGYGVFEHTNETVPSEALEMGHLVLEFMADGGTVSIICAEAYVTP